MGRIKNIDFLRILFALMIAFHHFTNMGAIKNSTNLFVSSLPAATFNLPFIVDFFFVMAGFFLVVAWKEQTVTEFIRNKFIKLFPLMLCYLLLIRLWSFMGIIDYPYKDSLFSLLLLDNVGLSINNSGVAWFISAYFVTVCFYYALIKNFRKDNVNLTIFLLIYFSYAFLVHKQNGNISGTYKTYYNILNVGMLRSIAGIGVGYFIGLWFKKLQSFQSSAKEKIIYTFAECSCFAYMIYFLLIKNPNLNSLVYVMTFCVLFMLFLLNKGYLSQLFNNNLSVVLGRYALAVYMIHEPVLRITRPEIWNKYPMFVTNHIVLTILAYLAIVFASAFIVHHLVEIPLGRIVNKLLFPVVEDTENGRNLRERERERGINPLPSLWSFFPAKRIPALQSGLNFAF